MPNKHVIQEHRKILKEDDKNMAATFKVLSDVNRYRIFRILIEQPKITVSTIAEILNISLPLASQHIKILVQANLLQKVRDGKKVFPKIHRGNPFIPAIIKTIKQAYRKQTVFNSLNQNSTPTTAGLP